MVAQPGAPTCHDAAVNELCSFDRGPRLDNIQMFCTTAPLGAERHVR